MVLNGTGSVYNDNGWYLVLLDIRWYEVSKGLVCLYILEKVEIWLGVTDASHLSLSQTTEYSATQLVSSIKFKLSHAIIQNKVSLGGSPTN